MTPRLRRTPRSSIDLQRADLTTLALRARGGDRDAEHVFIQRTMDEVWRYCAHVAGPSNADDAVQATYLRALRSLHNFRAESSAKTWLIGVAHNVCLDELRAKGRRDRLMAKAAAQPRDHTSRLDETPIELVEALAGLDETRREAFVLTQVLGFSYEDAAAIAGCPIGTVRSRVARARADLVEAVEEPPEERRLGLA